MIIDGITTPSGTVLDVSELDALDSSVAKGVILQVVSSTKTDTFTVTGTTFVDVPGLSVSITPTSVTSNILIMFNVNISASGRYSALKLFRGSTIIGVGDNATGRASVSVTAQSNQDVINDIHVLHNISMTFNDSPGVITPLVYKLQLGNTYDVGQTSYINKQPADTNQLYSHRGISTITLMEIAA